MCKSIWISNNNDFFNEFLQGELVYVHYGLESDFDYVASVGINVTGRIVLARYGLTFRGNIVIDGQ